MNPIQALNTNPSSLPGPAWLMLILLYLFFTVHTVFMNLTAGATLLESIFLIKGKPKHLNAARQLANLLPYSMAMTILFGVGTLLFVQVLYSRPFFTSTTLLGAPFILVIPILILSYSLIYYQASRWEKLGNRRTLISLAIFLMLGFTGFVWANISSLMLEPERFLDKYWSHPNGFQFDLVDPTLLPRVFHIFFAFIAIAGLYVAIRGTRILLRDPEQGRWQYRSGATWFAGATLVNFFIGVWRFMNLDPGQRAYLTGGNFLYTLLFAIGLTASLSAFTLALLGLNSLKPGPKLYACAAFVIVTIFCMGATRDFLRRLELHPYYSIDTLPVRAQWIAFGIFFVLLAGGIATCIWLLKQLSVNPPGTSLDPAGPGLTDSGLRKLSIKPRDQEED